MIPHASPPAGPGWRPLHAAPGEAANPADVPSDAERAARRRVAAAVAAERERIAHDLHDAVGGLLTATRILSGELADRLPPGEDADLAARVAAYASQAIEQVRAVSHGLAAAPDLATALAEIAAEADGVGGVRCTATVDTDVELPGDVVAEFILLVREAVGNALRHAQASTLTIRAHATDGRLSVEVTDDGTGRARPGGGLGHASMEARARRLGADLSIASSPDAGTTVRLVLPPLHSDPSSP